jgi:hypothetical protein
LDKATNGPTESGKSDVKDCKWGEQYQKALLLGKILIV